MSDGTVWAWGGNYEGELGNGTYTFASNTPVQVSGLSGVTAVAGGIYHSLALKAATPAQLINSLIGQVMSLGLSHGETTSLTAKLQAALGYLQANDPADAIAALRAFIDEVNALVNSGRLTASAAAPLISAAEGIIGAL
jgi:regulator of chromosome condensation (RCC1) repeat-containing protein/FIMAH domain-containing protein